MPSPTLTFYLRILFAFQLLTIKVYSGDVDTDTIPPIVSLVSCPGGETTFSACDPSTKTITITRCEDDIDIDPDTGASPIFSHIHISDCSALSSVTVTHVEVGLTFATQWVGDVQAFLLHNANRRQVMGVRNPPYGGCDAFDVVATFLDESTNAAFNGHNCDNHPGPVPPGLDRDHQPRDSFDTYIGESAAGTWTLEVVDVYGDEEGDGLFGEWTLTLFVSECSALPVGETCDGLDPCISAGVCTTDGECAGGELLTGVECDDYNPCTAPDLCSVGVCVPGTGISGGECTVRFPMNPSCATATCVSGECISTALGNAGSSCDYDSECSDDTCNNDGICEKGADCCVSKGSEWSHDCQCKVGGCGETHCNTIDFVKNKLIAKGIPVFLGDDDLCDAGSECCCHCPNCDK